MTPEEIAALVNELDEDALRLLAGAVAERHGNGRAARHRFWERLASERRRDDASIREEAAAAGLRLSPAYLAVALEFEAKDASALSGLRQAVRDVFERPDSGELGILERAGGLELLVPVPREIDAGKARTAATLLPRTIAKRHPGTALTGGVGGAGSPSDAADNLQRARAALAIARRIFGHGRVEIFEDLGAYALLYDGADIEGLRAFSDRVLLPLREYDEKHQTELERTLRVYFGLGQNVKTAAADLNVHRHTVFYRLRQIAEICRCDLGAPHDQLTLRLALAIHALHS